MDVLSGSDFWWSLVQPATQSRNK